ncbi:MAG: hypothetical protein KBT69_11895 [Oceanihabitans sp.]|nr:hypothetical protein [Oceanihabitans sp.]
MFSILRNKKETLKASSFNAFIFEKAVINITSNLEMYEAIWVRIVDKGEKETIYNLNTEEMLLENIVGIKSFKEHYANNLVGSKKKSFQLSVLLGK